MLTLLLAHVCLGESAADVREFFPMNPGDAWVFQDVSPEGTYESRDAVGEMIKIGEANAFPIVTTVGGREIDRAYYASREDGIYIVGFADGALTEPYAIIRHPDKVKQWRFEGTTFAQGAPADMVLTGDAKVGKPETFAGRSIETIIVTIEATILEKFGTPIKSVQKAVYGKGVGLLRSESSVKLKKRTVKSSKTLISYVPKGAS